MWEDGECVYGIDEVDDQLVPPTHHDAQMSTESIRGRSASLLTRFVGSYEEYDEALVATEGRTFPVGPERRPWEQHTLRIDDVLLQVNCEGGANFYDGAGPKDVVTLGLGLPAPTSISYRGASLDEGLVVIRPGVALSSQARDVVRYCLLVLPVDRFFESIERNDPTRIGQLVCGADCLDADPVKRGIALDMVDRVLRVAAAGQGLRCRAQRRAVLEELIGAFLDIPAKSSHGSKVVGRPKEPRERILRQVGEYLNSRPSSSYSVGEMATYAEVSIRTLRNVVGDRLGVTPKQLVMRRKLVDIRAALRRASPVDTVSAIAARYGVWDFGRLAQRYRELFGENPSETLFDRRGGP